MKIVFLARSAAVMHYYVTVVHERFPVARIIREVPSRPLQPRIGRRILQNGPGEIPKTLIARGRRLLARKEADAQRQRQVSELHEILGQRAAGFPEGVPITSVEDINSPTVLACLRDERPDVILVQGTRIVKDATLPKGVFNFNMHAGLSPYYRGGDCIAWALVNWDPYNIGVTLHQLTERADAGPIIAQRRMVPSPHDTSRSIELKLTRTGTSLAVSVLERFARGEPIQCHQQDVSLGYCYAGRHLHPEIRMLIQRIDREGLVGRMLETPSTGVRRPIVEWSGPTGRE